MLNGTYDEFWEEQPHLVACLQLFHMLAIEASTQPQRPELGSVPGAVHRNALTGIANSSLYTANKGAVHALARALAAELIGRGIRVNTITIGPTATRLLARSGSSPEILQAQDVARISRSPVKRLGRPEEVAKVALFLASDDSSFVVGSEIAADGGWLLNTM